MIVEGTKLRVRSLNEQRYNEGVKGVKLKNGVEGIALRVRGLTPVPKQRAVHTGRGIEYRDIPVREVKNPPRQLIIFVNSHDPGMEEFPLLDLDVELVT